MDVIPESEWKWFGHAGHLMVAHNCRFHLCTQVGPYLVSTVGEYIPDEPIRKIYCQARGIELVGEGDAQYADFMRKVGFIEIGYQRKYETMVFPAGEQCASEGCDCGLPEIGGTELSCIPYNQAGAAAAGHLRACRKWAAKEDDQCS